MSGEFEVENIPLPILVGNALGGINFASGTEQLVAQELRIGVGQV